MEVVAASLTSCSMSSVNATEVMAVMARSLGAGIALQRFRAFRIPLVPFGEEQAEVAQQLLWQQRRVISLGDAACLATAKTLGKPVLTADRIWATLPLPVEVRLIRP